MSPFIRRDAGSISTSTGLDHLATEMAPSLECCGCPDDNACRQYCVANYGARGGYCEGFLDLRCVCVY